MRLRFTISDKEIMMSFNKTGFRLKPSFGAGLLSMGIMFLIVGIVLSSEAYSFRRNAEETTAVVTEIEILTTRRKYGGENHNRMAYAQYTVDGEVYNSRLSGFYPNLSEGQQIQIIYNPENPASARSADYKSKGESFIPVSVIFIVLGSLLLAASLMTGGAGIRTNGRLVSDGIPVTAVIISVTLDTTVKIKGKYPYKALCEADNPVTGERFLYNSHGVEENIRHLVGKGVTVYCDPEDREKYYVDLDSVLDGTSESSAGINNFR